MFKVLTIFGTRPEAVKLAPILLELANYPDEIESMVCATGQHREMIDQVLALFNITPDFDLNLMKPGQGLADLTMRIFEQVTYLLREVKPHVIIVQGDTTTVMVAALAAFYEKITVAHVEAGLRSHDPYSPFPEELNRRLTSVLASIHFAPTEIARQALLAENLSKADIFVTGNTVIDALQMIITRPMPAEAQRLLDQVKRVTNGSPSRLILVTAHRRENFGQGLEQICCGIKSLVKRNPDIVVLFPVHLNPLVQEPVKRILSDVKHVILCDPVGYDVMAHLQNNVHLVLTDSGGIQEEAPTFGKPVLVMRTETERPEAVESGTAKLVGPDKHRILTETERLLHNPQAYREMAQAVSPYGDGWAAKRIVDILRLRFETISVNSSFP